MNTSPDHPDFTALSLGEHIHGTPAQALLETLRTSVAARVEAEQIQSVARDLSLALRTTPSLMLDATRRDAIFTADREALRARFAQEELDARVEEPVVMTPARRPRPTWIFPTAAAAAAAVAAFLALRFLPGVPASSTAATPAVQRDHKLTVVRDTPHLLPRMPNPATIPPQTVANQGTTPALPPQVDPAPSSQGPRTPPPAVVNTPPRLPDMPSPPANRKRDPALDLPPILRPPKAPLPPGMVASPESFPLPVPSVRKNEK